MTDPIAFDPELIEKVLKSKYTPDDVVELARRYSNAYRYAERVDFERALVEVEMNELKAELNAQAEQVLKIYKVTRTA